MTLEEQWLEAVKQDPRLREPGRSSIAKGAFLLGAQAVLEILRVDNATPATLHGLFSSLERINNEIGEWLARAGITTTIQ